MVNLTNFPLSAVVDGLISYLQSVFSNPEMVPDDYRWNRDDRITRIRISAPFVIDDEKPNSAPFIVVERGSFTKNEVSIDNLKNADPNTRESSEYTTVWDGSINIICGSRVGPEASSMANFLLINLDADRHGIIKALKFVRNLKSMNVGPEVPIQKKDEIVRYHVNISMFVSIQMGWKTVLANPTNKFNQFSLRTVDRKKWIASQTGQTTLGTNLLVDTSKDFGIYTTNEPQLLEQELQKGWYYVRFDTQLYKVASIINNNTLSLVNDDNTPWVAPVTATNVTYDLLWNSVHLFIQLPTE